MIRGCYKPPFTISKGIEVTEKLEHLTLKAVTTTTDQGLFEAVISTEALDREGDVVSAAGMVAALHKWNRPLPLAWEHHTDAKNIFGSIDTQSAKEVSGEVVVNGDIHLESEVGQEAWRSFKARTIGFSFGYLILQSTKRKGGGRDITELDVFEVTATATPMNNGTRVLSTKSTLPAWVDRLKELPGMDDEAVKQFIEDAGQIKEYIAAERADERSLRNQSNELALASALGWSEEQAKASGISEEVLKRNRDILTFADERQELDVLSVLKTVADLDLDLVKTIWTTAYINDLPDPAFLYIEPEEKGLRHFPYKDANGVVDLPHLRNALVRIPQANLPQDVEDRLTAKATRLLENAEKALSSVTDNPKGQKSDDLLRKRTFDLALDMAGGQRSALHRARSRSAARASR